MTDFHAKMATLFQCMSQGTIGPDEVRWLYIDAVLTLMGGNISGTAKRLGMHRRTLQRTISARGAKQ